LAANTHPDHPDHKSLTFSLEKMKELAVHINAQKMGYENIYAVICVQDKLVGKFEASALPPSLSLFSSIVVSCPPPPKYFLEF